jgi:RnfABCDGE-type electron transport complex B subunit
MTIVLITAVFALLLAFVLGLALGFFKQFFAVPVNPLIAEIKGILPGANCGACGFPGCEGYATAIAEKKTGVSSCPVGGNAVAEKLAALIGGAADVKPQVAVLACRGSKDKALQRGQYIGVKTCRAAKISTGSIKACTWGCQGFGDCAKVCQFGAITMGEDGLPDIDPEKCTGCLRCSTECPQHIIKIVPKDLRGAMPLCFNLNVLRTQVSKNCKNGCIKCEICVKNCPQQCLKMSNGIPVTDYAKCTSCGTCTEKCPVKVMKLYPDEAPVEDLDPA